MGIRERLAKLEQQRAGGGDDLVVVVIEGGLPADEQVVATAEAWRDDDVGSRRHSPRWADESEAAFRERAVAEARLRGDKFLIFGGLPCDEVAA